MELNINGIMDTAYSYGNERLTVERFDGWTGYYTYDPRGSVSGVTGMEGYIWQSYRYDVYGNITFGKPEYNNVYGYNAESYNPNLDAIYLRARYYNPTTADFMTEDSYLGDIRDPLTLNRYNYVKSSPLNYVDPSGKSSAGFLNSIAYLYTANMLNEKQVATLLLLKNPANIFLALHEIAQVNMEKNLREKKYWPVLEYPIKIDLGYSVAQASNASRVDECAKTQVVTREAHIVAGGYVWEIKSKNQYTNDKKLEEANIQLEQYIKYGKLKEGKESVFNRLDDIYIKGY